MAIFAKFLVQCPIIELRNPAQAVELAEAACGTGDEDPLRAPYPYILGVVYYRVGKYQAALAALETGTQPPYRMDGETFFFLSMAHLRLDHYEEAWRQYEQGVAWIRTHCPLPELNSLRAETEQLFQQLASGQHKDL
jgi:tetratricopeptide (TPR) repeat protein